jgi:hypothetical protein
MHRKLSSQNYPDCDMMEEECLIMPCVEDEEFKEMNNVKEDSF